MVGDCQQLPRHQLLLRLIPEPGPFGSQRAGRVLPNESSKAAVHVATDHLGSPPTRVSRNGQPCGLTIAKNASMTV